jgi:hypothetical protein
MLTFDSITWTPERTYPAVDAAARAVLAALSGNDPLPHLAPDAQFRFESPNSNDPQTGETALHAIRELRPQALRASSAHRGLAGGTVILHRARLALGARDGTRTGKSAGSLLIQSVWMRRGGAWALHELSAAVVAISG